MKRWQRWITFTILVLLALGPGPFWSPSKAKADSGFSQGWTAVPLPQQLLEAKAKFASLGLIAVALGLAMHSPSVPICLPPAQFMLPPRRRLYLDYSRLQTDGG
jgi:hypothetical protein